MRKQLLLAASAMIAVAAFLFGAAILRSPTRDLASGFVLAKGLRFAIDGQPFRFVAAPRRHLYRDEDRERCRKPFARQRKQELNGARLGLGEGGPNDVKPLSDFNDWPRTHVFRTKPNEWNEAEFVFLDQVMAEAARNGLRVQLCLTNWWRDTGGITQYLRWSGIEGADDDKHPFGINLEKAMLFYSNETARRLYREHIEKVVARRNTVTGKLYRDDPAIFGYELMNEAQCITGRWEERRAWFAEMSAYVKSLDPNHMVTPGDRGYRSAAERREWLKDHALPSIDYCDVHNYPRDDHDLVVDSPTALHEFIQNRVPPQPRSTRRLSSVNSACPPTALMASVRSNGFARSSNRLPATARAARCSGFSRPTSGVDTESPTHHRATPRC